MKILLVLSLLSIGQLCFAESFYDFRYKDTNGVEIDFKNFSGKVVLLANIATKCGFTGQLDDLEKLYAKYKDKGLVVIGMPSNNFLSQTPEGNVEVGNFCRLKYGVSFPITEKVEVVGDAKTGVIKWINSQEKYDGNIKWNFEKFIIDRNGKIVDRFRSITNPLDSKVVELIEKELAKNKD